MDGQMKNKENNFKRNLERSLTKTRGEIYRELPRRQKAVYWIFVISVFLTIGAFVFFDVLR